MPIYVYRCDKCVLELEKVQGINEEAALCPNCGNTMARLPTFPAMVKIKGEGGYPSRRKFVKGSAPFTTRNTKAWLDSNPSGRHWLSTDAQRRASEKLEAVKTNKGG